MSNAPHMMSQNPSGPPPYLPQMAPTPTIGSTLSSNPSYQSSPNQNNGDINANKKTPKEKTPMCQVTWGLIFKTGGAQIFGGKIGRAPK